MPNIAIYHWTSAIDEELRRIYSSGAGALRTLSAVTGIPKASLSKRARVVLKLPALREKKFRARPFTIEEDVIITKYGYEPARRIAERLAKIGQRRGLATITARRAFLRMQGVEIGETDYFSASEIAEGLGCSYSTVLTWIKTGRLKARALNPHVQQKNYSVTPDDLTRFLRANPARLSGCNPDFVWYNDLLLGSNETPRSAYKKGEAAHV